MHHKLKLWYGLDLKNALTGHGGGLESIHSILECMETLWPFKDICACWTVVVYTFNHRGR